MEEIINGAAAPLSKPDSVTGGIVMQAAFNIAALEETDFDLAAGHYYFPYGSANPPSGDVPAFMWQQWPDVPLLFLQYTGANQHSDDIEVIWPEAYRTSDGPIVRTTLSLRLS